MTASSRAALSAVALSAALSLAACRDATAPDPQTRPLRPRDPVVRVVDDSMLVIDACDPRGGRPGRSAAFVRLCQPDDGGEPAAACACADDSTR